MAIYLISGKADIGHYGNHSEMEDWPNNRYDWS